MSKIIINIFEIVKEKIKYATVAQSVERRIGSAEVTGPIPVSSSFEKRGNLENTRFPLFLCA